MTTKQRSALDGLQERREAIDAARLRVVELEGEARSSQRDLDRAIAPLQDYYRSIETGEAEPDPKVEAELREAVTEAQASIAPQAVFNPRAEQGEGMRVEMVNPRLQGMLDGARDKLTEAEVEYDRFLRTRFGDLVVELGVKGQELAEKYAPVAQQAREAQREWSDLRHAWRPLVEAGSIEWRDFPPSPFSEVGEMPVLMPRQLAAGESLGAPGGPKKRKQSS